MIERVEDEAGFRALREEWTQLLDESDAAHVFLTWEWLFTWWRHLAPRMRPALRVVRRQGRLAALLPLVEKGWEPRRLRLFRTDVFLGAPLAGGNVGSDYLDVLVSRDHPDAFCELAESLAREGRLLELAQVAADDSRAAALVGTLRRAAWNIERREAGVCPIVDLEGHTWDSYLASRGREHRYTVQRKLKALRKNFAVTWDAVTTESDRAQALALLIDLHQRRWRDKGDSDAFHTPALRSFHEDFTRLALARGWLRLYVLRLDGVPAAALYGLRYGSSFSFYQSGFDPAFSRHGVGVATMALSIEAALGEGARRYDMLHGTEAYKFHWTSGSRPLVTFSLFPPRPQGHMARAISAARGWLRPVARRVLQGS